MIVLITLALVACAFIFLRKPKASQSEPVRHFEIHKDDSMWTFTVRPTGFVMPVAWMALIPGALVAVFVTALWVTAGHDLDRSGGVFFAAWLLGAALAFGPMRKRAQVKAAGTTFSVGPGGVILANGGGVTITGQYVLNRRNSAAYGKPAAHAHVVSLDVDGVTYVLAEGMTDPQSMALYHEVGRRLRGDP